MKGYLQRLTDRAQGVSMTPSIVPAGHSLMTRDPSPDPFTSDQAAESLSALNKTPGDRHDSLLRPFMEVDQPAIRVPGKRRSWRSEPAMTESAPELVEVQPGSDSRVTRLQPPVASEVFPPGDIEFAKPKGDSKQPAEAKVTSTLLSPTQNVEERFPAERRVEEKTAHLDPATQIVAAQTLEPRPLDTFRPAIPPPDEPRLVIGELRVDVSPTAASPAREVVRTVTRIVSSNQSTGVSRPISRLRFGLGQM